MKSQADGHRSEQEFQVGDMVYLKLQPHLQSSVASRSNYKLSFRYYGPFQIEKRVGTVAYKLQLPPHSQIHPAVHVSQLTKHVLSSVQATTDLSSVCTDPDHILQPIQVVDTALKPHAGSTARRILGQWSGMSATLAT
ncbi:hypothetical protein BS78_07G125600 [Paspalum vaginatum]|nr:hypothetical protein BS78_07G125600 [Paspalum vaginatum]